MNREYLYLYFIAFFEINQKLKKKTKKNAKKQECQLPTGYKNSDPSCRYHVDLIFLKNI